MLKLKSPNKAANKENLKEHILRSIASLFIYLFIYLHIYWLTLLISRESLITLGFPQNTSLMKTLNNCS